MTESNVSMISEPELREMIQSHIEKMQPGDYCYVAWLDKVIRVDKKGPNSVDFRTATPNEMKLKPEVRFALNKARQLDGQVPTACNDCLLAPNPFLCWVRAQFHFRELCLWMQTNTSRRSKIETVKLRIRELELEQRLKVGDGRVLTAEFGNLRVHS